MKNQGKFSHSLFIVAFVTVLILMVPLVAMQFTDEVKWSFPDFIIMFFVLFGTGTTFVLLARKSTNNIHRIAVVVAVASAFLMVFVNMAVGLIGSGPNSANLMYAGVVAVGIIGALRARFEPRRMEQTMYAVVLALGLLTVIALGIKVYQRTDSSITEIIGVNVFFAALFTTAGLLFRYGKREQIRTQS